MGYMFRKMEGILVQKPYMASIYPDQKSREALEVFQMTDRRGEFFDLSTKPITRAEFYVGNKAHEKAEMKPAYFISDQCIGCGRCFSVCPQKCIDTTKVPFMIAQEHCIHCGNCFLDCPVHAVVHNA